MRGSFTLKDSRHFGFFYTSPIVELCPSGPFLHAHTLLPNENALSLISTNLGEDSTPYYIVGTAFVNGEDPEPKSGRIIVFHYNEGQTQQRCVMKLP
ncbi:hypothetical protein RRG08_002004 [Elysia crispata]|uniref:RSE1/DDB1/CPSF1 C-terminal domain-containing protein n=2 Tax=Elysia crispata TaxID=231223 RepID=A0AAE1CRJ9_9GAST|nr:hypothetical protein RRG08_002004 [Elysia crispata]